MGALAALPWTTWAIAAAATARVIVRPFSWPEWVWAVAGALLLVLFGLLPVRDGAELAQRLAAHPDRVFAYDGVERGVARNRDYEAQAEEYSAKKKPIA